MKNILKNLRHKNKSRELLVTLGCNQMLLAQPHPLRVYKNASKLLRRLSLSGRAIATPAPDDFHHCGEFRMTLERQDLIKGFTLHAGFPRS